MRNVHKSKIFWKNLKYDMDSNLPVMAARMRLKTVALIIPDITNPFFGEMARAIGTRMNEKGYSLLLGDSLFFNRDGRKMD